MKTMAKRKPVEAWAVIRDGIVWGRTYPTRLEAMTEARAVGHDMYVVHLVESSPAERAVIRAAVRWAKVPEDEWTTKDYVDAEDAIRRAVARLLKERGGKP
jgi:hypothetical protein